MRRRSLPIQKRYFIFAIGHPRPYSATQICVIFADQFGDAAMLGKLMMGLGNAISVPLVDARDKAANARRKAAQGLNPIDERERDGGIPTFGEMADEVYGALSAGFRNEKHKAQWRMTLETYAAPLRAKPVDTIGTDDILISVKRFSSNRRDFSQPRSQRQQASISDSRSAECRCFSRTAS
jgi:hypothetical protein